MTLFASRRLRGNELRSVSSGLLVRDASQKGRSEYMLKQSFGGIGIRHALDVSFIAFYIWIQERSRELEGYSRRRRICTPSAYALTTKCG